MPHSGAAYILEMLLAACDGVSFRRGISFDDFVRERPTQLSVLKSVEIFGETATQVGQGPSQAESGHPLSGNRRYVRSARA